MTTRATVEELLRRMASGDAETTAELFTEEVDFFGTMNANFVPEDRAASISGFLVDGEDAVVMGHVSQRLKSNGRAFTIPFALHLTVSDGLITRYHIYEDSLTVAEAVTA